MDLQMQARCKKIFPILPEFCFSGIAGLESTQNGYCQIQAELGKMTL